MRPTCEKSLILLHSTDSVGDQKGKSNLAVNQNMAKMQAYKTATNWRQWAAYTDNRMVRDDLQEKTFLERN